MKAITGVTLIDGTGSDPMKNATVVIDGEKIATVDQTEANSIPERCQVIDASGMYMLPGLIDCHDHLAMFGYDLASRWGLTELNSLRHMRTADVLKRTLETGYTTVRDAAGLDAGFKQAVELGLIAGPRLHVALSIITPTGGIGDSCSASGHTNPAGSHPGLPSGVANGVEAVRAKVREVVMAGADVIKCATTGGASSRSGFGPEDSLMTRAELDALIDEAHGLGRRVMCHALGGTGLRMAIEAGVDSIEHGNYLGADQELLPLMAEKGIFFTPTFSVYKYHAEQGSTEGKIRAAAAQKDHVKSLEQAMYRGVNVVAGTDAGGWLHGNNAEEIKHLVCAGMSPMDALRAATSVAAQCLGLEDEIGTISPGMKADIILVDGNPLQDVSILEEGKSIKLVLKSGEVAADRFN